MKPAVPIYVYFIALWPIAGVLVWAVVNARRDTRREKLSARSLEWPRTQGAVTENKQVFDHIEVHYRYSVEGKEYTGIFKDGLPPMIPDRYGQFGKAIMAANADAVADYPVGAKLILNYNPTKPEESNIYCVEPTSPAKSMPSSDDGPTFGSLD